MSEQKREKISIIGCGWLGLPLAKHLIGLGYAVKGSTTSVDKLEKLRDHCIEAYCIDLSNPDSVALSQCLSSDILVVNVPPSRIDGSFDALIKAVEEAKLEKVVYVSTTSVYPDSNNEVFEEDAQHIVSKHSGVDNLALEEQFTLNTNFKTTVVRFAGLYNTARNPGRFLAGKKNLKGKDNPINLIHLDDCVGVITALIEKDIWGETFNACSDTHPKREAFYTLAANKLGLEPPKFSEEPAPFKTINADKLKTAAGYRYIHPDPMKTI
ncbi:MAG: SDR family oxidoreductase [Bacteroidota bacterium]